MTPPLLFEGGPMKVLALVLLAALTSCSSSKTSNATNPADGGGAVSCDGGVADPPGCAPIGAPTGSGTAYCCQTGPGLTVGAGGVSTENGACVPRCNSTAD